MAHATRSNRPVANATHSDTLAASARFGPLAVRSGPVTTFGFGSSGVASADARKTAAALPPLIMTAVIFHQVALFESNAWSAGLVPAAFAAFALAGMASTYLTGLVLERVPSRFGLALALALLSIALGAVKGVVNAARNGATAIDRPLAAALMTDTGSFGPGLLVFGGSAVAGGISALVLRPPTAAPDSVTDEPEAGAADVGTRDAA